MGARCTADEISLHERDSPKIGENLRRPNVNLVNKSQYKGGGVAFRYTLKQFIVFKRLLKTEGRESLPCR